jgi:hypothetical protein
MDRRRVGAIVADELDADLEVGESRIVEGSNAELAVLPREEDVGRLVVRARRREQLDA